MNTKEQVSRDELFLSALLLISSLLLIVCT